MKLHSRPSNLASLTTLSVATIISGLALFSFTLPAGAQISPSEPVSTTAPAPTPSLDQQSIQLEEPATPGLPSDTLTLTAIPPRLGDEEEMRIAPGEKIQTSVRIKNSSNQAIAIETLAEDFILGEDGVTPVPVGNDVSNRWSLAQWITLSPTTQTLQPQQTATVNVLIEVPSDALPGGHYAMIMHQPVGDQTAGASQSRIGQRVGTLVYFIVDGPINEQAFVREFKFNNFSEYGPVPFSFSVENMSDIHITPRIGIEIFNIFGQRVETLAVESKNVFPLLSRDFEGQWDRVWGIGPYTAKMTMSYGTSGSVVMASTQFWLVPIKLVIAIGAGLVAVLGILVAVRRHILHRRNNDSARVRSLEQKVKELEQEKLQKYE
ncbi:MAG: LapA family protein [bacterium]|nr:LapA family protein [bacterium]